MKKIKSEKGFTLAELLIVVAIIAVLVAIAIPIFTKQIEKSREAVDLTSMRNAYALASVAAITEDKVDGIEFKNFTGSNPAYYDGGGSLTTSKPSPYGKGKRVDAETTYHACSDYGYDAAADYTGSVVMVWYDGTEVHVHWENVGSGNVPDQDTPGGNEPENPPSGNEPENPPSGSETEAPETEAPETENTSSLPGAIINGAAVFPESSENYPNGENGFSTVKGNVYSYKGKAYVAIEPLTYHQYNNQNPENTGLWGFVELKSDAPVYNSTYLDNNNQIPGSIPRGSLYQEGSNTYIMFVQTEDANYQGPPATNPNWIRINM